MIVIRGGRLASLDNRLIGPLIGVLKVGILLKRKKPIILPAFFEIFSPGSANWHKGWAPSGMNVPFSFIYPLTQRRVDLHRSGGWRFDHMGDLVVSGYARDLQYAGEDDNDRYEFDIDEITYNGTNIYPVLEVFEGLDKIEAACYHHIHHMFIGEPSDYEIPALRTTNPPAKVFTLHLRRKAK